MALSGRELAGRAPDGRIRVRADSLRCRLHLRGLSTSDSHALDATFTFSVHALDEKAERQMLAEAFLGQRQTTTADDVADHFTPALRQALAGCVAAQPVRHWIDAARKPELLDLLRSAAKPLAFGCGVELLPPFDLSIESPTLERARLEQMQRDVIERRAAGQIEHVQHAAELFKRFQSLRDAMPGLSPGQLLDRINPAERAGMLESLMLASGSTAQQTLWAAAGPNLLRIDPRASASRIDLIELPTDLGPLRSVQPSPVGNTAQLLIGAQKGVMQLDPARPTQAIRYIAPETASPLGFNSVSICGDMIFATHGQAGLLGWRIGQTEKPAISLPVSPLRDSAGGSAGSDGPRNATSLDDGRLLYSIAGQLLMLDREHRAMQVGDGDSPIILIAPDRDHVALVRASGWVQWLDPENLTVNCGAQRAGNLCAAATLPWLGTMRLLLASEAGPVFCIGADDSLTTQYASAHRGLRAISATTDLIAALSPDRQRIILWNTWSPSRPTQELHASNRARHRIADLCFA